MFLYIYFLATSQINRPYGIEIPLDPNLSRKHVPCKRSTWIVAWKTFSTPREINTNEVYDDDDDEFIL